MFCLLYNFIADETHPITCKSIESRNVDPTNNGTVNQYLRDVDHGSLSSTTQDHIFHIHVRLDIWRRRSTRIHVRLDVPDRKTTNSNGNQLCRVFCRTQWEWILFVCYEGNGAHLAPIITQSSDDHLRELCVSITSEKPLKHTVTSRQRMVTCSCSPSLPPCCWIPVFPWIVPLSLFQESC